MLDMLQHTTIVIWLIQSVGVVLGCLLQRASLRLDAYPVDHHDDAGCVDDYDCIILQQSGHRCSRDRTLTPNAARITLTDVTQAAPCVNPSTTSSIASLDTIFRTERWPCCRR